MTDVSEIERRFGELAVTFHADPSSLARQAAAEAAAHAMTVTIPALLRAWRVIVVCPEAAKAEAVGRALLGPVHPSCPASILRTAPHARLHLDTESAKALPPS